MSEYDPSPVLGAIGAVVSALLAVGVAAREYIKREKLSDAQRNASVAGAESSESILRNLREEVARLADRIEDLEKKVEDLTNKLANVRMVAIDCYTLANACECDNEARAKLLEHLRQIIREA